MIAIYFLAHVEDAFQRRTLPTVPTYQSGGSRTNETVFFLDLNPLLVVAGSSDANMAQQTIYPFLQANEPEEGQVPGSSVCRTFIRQLFCSATPGGKLFACRPTRGLELTRRLGHSKAGIPCVPLGGQACHSLRLSASKTTHMLCLLINSHGLFSKFVVP